MTDEKSPFGETGVTIVKRPIVADGRIQWYWCPSAEDADIEIAARDERGDLGWEVASK